MNPLKKFVVAAVLLLAGTQSVAAKPTFVGSLGGINTLLDVRVEVDAANACDATAYSDGSVTRGLASVYPPFLKKIEKEFGHGTIHPTALEEAAHQVQTKRFTETTQLHRDSYTNEHGVRQSVAEDGKVGFIFRNTNEDAHFETDDDGGFCFPAVKGTFMTFDGSIPHQTIVKSGHVELIGPFLLSSKALFGVGIPPIVFRRPTPRPTARPTLKPTVARPTARPTLKPTLKPTVARPSARPTLKPTVARPSARPGSKASKSPTTAKSSKTGGDKITSQQLASNQANKPFLSFLIAGTMIVAAAALLNIASKWAQKWRQARSINDLEEEAGDFDGFKEDQFEDEPMHSLSDDIVGEGEGNVEIVETY